MPRQRLARIHVATSNMITQLKAFLNRIILGFPALVWLKLKLKFYLGPRRKIKKQLRCTGNRNIRKPSDVRPKRILIPLIETQHYQIYQMFILAKALQLRGMEVKILLCGSRLDGCETKSVRTANIKDPCLRCRFHYRHLVPLFDVPIVLLSDLITHEEVQSLREIAATVTADYPAHYEYKGIDIIPMTDGSVTRYYYGAVPSNPEQLETVRREHLTSSMMGIDASERIEKQFSPDIILNNMFVYSVTEPYARYFGNKVGKELFAIAITPADYHSIIINMMDPYKSTERFLRYLEFRGNGILTDPERDALGRLLDLRYNGDITMFKENGYFNKGQNVNDLLSIDKKKKNIFLFSNVYWDLGMSESGRIFSDIILWVLQTIEILKDQDDIHLYIKPHPAERFDSASSLKGIEDCIREALRQLPKNVTIISPELKITTYDLFPYIDLGIVYNSTLGLEMLLKNIPVVLTGDAPYGRLGLAHEPRTLEEYEKMLVGDIEPIIPDKNKVELFAYFYFIKHYIPWNLTERAYDDRFKGYAFESLDDILPGKNKYLDHICSCILDSQNTVIESWQ